MKIPSENRNNGTIINNPRLNDALLIVMHSIAYKTLSVQNFASFKYPNKNLEITAAHIGSMIEYQEQEFLLFYRECAKKN